MNGQMLELGLAFGLTFFLTVAMTCSTVEAQERIKSEVKITSGRQLNPREKQAVSLAAGRILIHVNHARNHLRHNRDKEALPHVEKAIALAKIIETAVPEYRVESTIKAGNLLYQDQETVKSLVVPVYPELDNTGTVLVPVKRAKRAIAASGDNSLEQSENQLQCTTVLLDVGEAKYYLDEAAHALKRLEFPSAETALLSIQEEVEFDFDEVNVSLVKARWQLLDAARKVSAKQYHHAKEALHKAAGALETYTTQVGEGMSSTARGLADDINSLAIKLDENKERAVETIHGFWGRVVDLM